MNTRAENYKDGRLISFEVLSRRISKAALREIINKNIFVSELIERGLFSSSPNIFEFSFKRKKAIVFVPFGDNDCFWVASSEQEDPIDLYDLKTDICRYETPFLRNLMLGFLR